MTIRRRITTAAATAVAITVVIFSVGAFLAARQQVLSPIDESLLERAEIIAEVPVGDIRQPDNGLRRLGNVILRSRPGEFDAVYYQIVFPNGSTVNVGDEDLILPPPPEGHVQAVQPALRSVRVDGLHLRVATLYEPGSDAYVQIARPLTEADQSLRRFAVVLMFGSLVGVGIAIGLGILVSRNAVQPLADLRDDVSGITGGTGGDGRLPVSGDDEVASLASAFNELLDRLDASKAQQVRLVRDAGHELRTPLTALRMNLEILQRHDVPDSARAAMLGAAHDEVEELTDLVGEIVDLATDRYQEELPSEVALDDVVAGVVRRQERRNGRSIEVTSDGSVVVGKREALERAVANLVANADAWSPESGVIEVTIEDGTVSVSDHGPGIAPDDLPHVFERFYRSDIARTKPGSGLGLSIVDQIVEDHRGTVFARNRTDGTGAVVGFRIPSPPG
jgi:two-component system sensor histidine kinase MprB